MNSNCQFQTTLQQSVMSESSQQQSQFYENAPKLSSRGLTTLLIGMCLVPMVTLFALKQYLPPVFEGKLQANISAEQLPAASFYDTDYRERPPVHEPGVLIIENDSDQDWTHLSIRVNKHYQIASREPIVAGEARRYRLDRFVSRTGARFQVRYNPLKYVQIYARRPTGDRATFSSAYDWEAVE